MLAEATRANNRPAISIVIPVFNAEDTLDECIEVGLVSGEKVQISISASCPEANPERVAEFAKHLSEVAVAAKNFKYAGCTIVR